MREALFPTPNTMSEYGAYYRTITAHLIETKSFSLVGKGTRSLDIVRDVFNLVPVHWISRKIVRYLGNPLAQKPFSLKLSYDFLGWHSVEDQGNAARCPH